ncbi:MAG: hypothetical protein ACLFS7_08555 [Desulfosudaceae bacterium]
MGKKSLFESTSTPPQNDRESADQEKGTVENQDITSQPADDTKARAAAETSTGKQPDTPENATAAPASPAETTEPSGRTAAASSARPRPSRPAQPDRTATSANTPAEDLSSRKGSSGDSGQPVQGDNLLKTVVAIIGGLMLLLFLASLFQANNYYIKQVNGSVEIWKGTFTPAGQKRLLILHGTKWDRPAKEVYSKKTVYTFAARTYLQKALDLTGVSGLPDYSRIEYYLEEALELVTEIDNRQAADTIRQVKTYLAEAAILDASGEQEALALAGKRLDAIQQSLSGLLAETVILNDRKDEVDEDKQS